MILGDQVIVKMMRRVDPGPNPEVEVGRFLTERAGFEHAAPLLGALEVSMNGRAAAFAVVHRYVPNLGDAWSHTLTSLSLVYEQLAARRVELGRPPALSHPLEMGDEELDVVHGLTGVLLHEAALLGQRTGEMHLALARSRTIPNSPRNLFPRSTSGRCTSRPGPRSGPASTCSAGAGPSSPQLRPNWPTWSSSASRTSSRTCVL